MKITKKQLRKIIRETLEEYSHSGYRQAPSRGGFGKPTVREIESMIQRAGWSLAGREGIANILQKRALAANLSKNDLESRFAKARISSRDTKSSLFQKLGLKY